jgi:hypothetical protein
MTLFMIPFCTIFCSDTYGLKSFLALSSEQVPSADFVPVWRRRI